MPPEIADSDADSDFDSPRRPSASPIPENNELPPPSTLESIPFANIEFDQFLSPTQRLSSTADQQDVITSRSTTSTDKFLQDIAQADQRPFHSTANSHGTDGSFEQESSAVSRNKAKRSLSDIEAINSGAHQKSLKRAKTYGSSRSHLSDAALSTGVVDPYNYDGENRIKEQLLQESNSTSAELPVQPLVDPEGNWAPSFVQQLHSAADTRGYNQRGGATFVQSNLQNSFMTKSFMGGYEGINMDFRGAGLGLDTNANPFGSLSQVSLDGDLDPSETEKFTSLFRHTQDTTDKVAPEHTLDPAVALQPTHLKEMATSPVGSAETRRERITSDHQKEVHQGEVAKGNGKKRGRKSKDAENSFVSEMAPPEVQRAQSEDPLDLLQEHHNPSSSRPRADTVESVNSHATAASRMTDTSKSKRKRSEKSDTSDNVNSKPLSSELNLSDPIAIGAPKELYVPRPSKSRSRQATKEEPRIEDDEGGSVDRSTETVTLHDGDLIEARSSIPEAKKKPGRKSKVKRAKTSAAALLKSAEMYDEDDKDCIVVEEVPAKVRMDPLPDISSVKHKTEDIKVDTHTKVRKGESDVDGIRREPSSDVKISVDIPKLSGADGTEAAEVLVNPEPKKRGRKPKKKPPVHQDEDSKDAEVEARHEPAEQPSAVVGEPTNTRQALIEKDPNKDTPSPLPPGQDLSKDATPILSTTASSPTKSILITRSSTPGGTTLGTKYRVGLSRRTTIPSLLRKLDRTREPPKVNERKEKLSKRQQEEEDKRKLEAEDNGVEYEGNRYEIRGKDGMLMEWDE